MKAAQSKRILLTSGPTWVSIDGMRVISNRSSGLMGRLICEDLFKAGHRVTVLQGPVQERIDPKYAAVKPYCFYDELARLLKKELLHPYDVVIHASAVSDFKPKHSRNGKIKSTADGLTLELVPTEKLIDLIKHIRPDTHLIGFKLESSVNPQSALRITKKMFTRAGCDLVIANSFTDHVYRAYGIEADGKCSSLLKSRIAVAKFIGRKVEEWS